MPRYFISFISTFLISISIFNVLSASSVLVDFNNTSDLLNKFTSDGSPEFSNSPNGGINNTGAIDVPLGSSDIWTTKQSYSVSGSGDIYTFSSFFKIEENSGYGGLGFANQSVNDCDYTCSPEYGIGMIFHGGGGSFVNNRDYTDVNWPPDLVLGNWYKMVLVVENKGSNSFDLNFKIYNSDSSGTVGSLKTEHELLGVTNSQMGTSSNFYGYFAAAGSRMAYIDDYLIELDGGASFIEEGAPIILTSSVTSVTSNSAVSGGNVTSSNGSSVTARGVCYSTSPNPTTSNTCTNNGTGLGVFTANLTDLSHSTTYYLRAYATNTSGTSYGSEQTFTTLVGTDPAPDPETIALSVNPVFHNRSCLLQTPVPTTWITVKKSTSSGLAGIEINWVQYFADKVSIWIDNGTNSYPYRISRTLNDGKEFLPNVESWQKIRIIPHNGCKSGVFSPGISLDSHRFGWYNH